ILGIILSIKSVEIKKTQQELLAQQEKYRLLTEYSNDVIWKMSRNGKFLYVSPSVEKLRGFSSSEVMKQSISDTLTPSSLKTVEELMAGFEGVINSNPGKSPSVITELEQTCKDGSTVWTEVSVKTVLGKDGQPDCYIGVTRDITERKRKELDLKRSEEYYRLMAETIMDFIIVHDLQGKIIFVNPAGIKASGYSEEEIIGSNIRDFIPQDLQGSIEEFWNRRAYGDLSTFQMETLFSTRYGESTPVELSSAPVLINQKCISELIAARDISERKKVEVQNRNVQEKIKKLNAELEEKVKDRTHKLEQANKDLESFAYTVSHDLHAPLRHISTFSDLLKKSLDKGENNKTNQYLQAITSSVIKMKDLINSLLQLSRTGRSQIKKEVFEMDMIVHQVIRDVEIDYPDKTIGWKISSLGTVNADIRLMKQVWYNLVSNAVKFTNGEKAPAIEIGKTCQKNKTIWYIKDNGVGFNPKYMDKLFGVFQRLHPEDEFEGTGIGLATVKQIINKHKGEIWAESEPNKGAVFYFYFKN
ncbi:MAG: PAS domain-containing sensor histidine kinase, partial [Bacteroidota bacterium]